MVEPMQDYVLSPRTKTWFEKIPAAYQGTRPNIGFEDTYRGFTYKQRPEHVIYDIIPPEGKVVGVRYLDGGHTSIEKLQKAVDGYYAEMKVEAYEDKKLVDRAFLTPKQYDVKVQLDKEARKKGESLGPDQWPPDLYKVS